MAEMTNERDVKASVKQLLTQHGWMWWMPPANGYGTRTVDFLALKDGHFLAVETKFATRPVTVNQIKFLKKVAKSGGTAFVVTELGINALAHWLETHTHPVTAEMLDTLAVLTAPLRSDKSR